MASGLPSLSIVTAARNAALNLESLRDSLRAQVDREFTWIVSIGDSSDGTDELLRNETDLDVMILQGADFGIYDALNRAIRAMSTTYYVVVGSDDLLEPDAVSDYRAAAATTGADLVVARVRRSGGLLPVRRTPAWIYGASAVSTAHSVGTLIRRALHDEAGLYSRMFPIAADSLFLKVVASRGATIHYADFVAGTFGEGGVSSRDTVGALSEFFRVQLRTERSVGVQLSLYILRLIRNAGRLR